jgi:predicted nucleic acid-binding protein
VEVDPDDDKLFEAAVAGNVDYLALGDKYLLDPDPFRAIEIVDP